MSDVAAISKQISRLIRMAGIRCGHLERTMYACTFALCELIERLEASGVENLIRVKCDSIEVFLRLHHLVHRTVYAAEASELTIERDEV